LISPVQSTGKFKIASCKLFTSNPSTILLLFAPKYFTVIDTFLEKSFASFEYEFDYLPPTLTPGEERLL